VTDAQTTDGCFAGARLFNEDDSTFDPVPYAANIVGFTHPKMTAIQLHEGSDYSLSKQEFSCSSKVAAEGLGGGTAFPSRHLSSEYLYRTRGIV